MQPFCQVLDKAGLLKEGVILKDFANKIDQEFTTCEQVLANWDVKRILDRIDLGVSIPITPQSFCKILMDKGLVADSKKQDCLDFYQTHPLPY